MIRFLVSAHQIHGNRFTLTGPEAHHAIHVHRKSVGDLIALFDGEDASYVGYIEAIHSNEVHGTLVDRAAAAPLSIQITLYQALIKGPRWDWFLQKASELGVHRVVPLVTTRTIVKVRDDSSDMKLERWHRIATEASKQCGRADILSVATPQTFAQALDTLPAKQLSLIPWEKEESQSIQTACQGYAGKTVALFIGPEGGWESAEIQAAQLKHLIPVRLGPTLLRSETAGLVAATLTFSELGLYA